jgi:lipoprotein-releasing system permease protein
MQFTWRGQPFTRTVRLIGVDAEQRAKLGGFADYMVLRRGRPSFALSDEGRARQEWRDAPRRRAMDSVRFDPPLPGEKPAPELPQSKPLVPEGIIVGYALSHFRHPQTGEDVCTLEEGDDVRITTVGGGDVLSPVWTRYAVADYFRSEMSEYDANYVFVPLKHLQHLRTLEDHATSIQIRLKDYDRDAKEVVERLKALFAGAPVEVETWEDKQGPLLSAISVEKGILNLLLFTRDIGILKALGASNGGVLKIFLGYGLLLGVVGAAVGSGLGLTISTFINEIEQFLTRVTGSEIFPRSVYYFKEIPTDIQPAHVLLVNLGAVAIAVLFSILPALRAALLHPVRALRYE